MTTLLLAAAAEEGDVNPGLLGFVVVALLAVATWLLLRSMRRQIKRIDLPEDAQPDLPEDDQPDRPDRDDRPTGPSGP